jgi:hypothetical protein
VIDSQPKDAPDGPLVVVTSTICPVSSAVPRLVLFPSESGGKRMPDKLQSEGYGPSLCMPERTGRRRSGAAVSGVRVDSQIS